MRQNFPMDRIPAVDSLSSARLPSLSLPVDCIAIIISCLQQEEWIQAMRVDQAWNSASKSPASSPSLDLTPFLGFQSLSSLDCTAVGWRRLRIHEIEDKPLPSNSILLPGAHHPTRSLVVSLSSEWSNPATQRHTKIPEAGPIGNRIITELANGIIFGRVETLAMHLDTLATDEPRIAEEICNSNALAPRLKMLRIPFFPETHRLTNLRALHTSSIPPTALMPLILLESILLTEGPNYPDEVIRYLVANHKLRSVAFTGEQKADALMTLLNGEISLLQHVNVRATSKYWARALLLLPDIQSICCEAFSLVTGISMDPRHWQEGLRERFEQLTEFHVQVTYSFTVAPGFLSPATYSSLKWFSNIRKLHLQVNHFWLENDTENEAWSAAIPALKILEELIFQSVPYRAWYLDPPPQPEDKFPPPKPSFSVLPLILILQHCRQFRSLTCDLTEWSITYLCNENLFSLFATMPQFQRLTLRIAPHIKLTDPKCSRFDLTTSRLKYISTSRTWRTLEIDEPTSNGSTFWRSKSSNRDNAELTDNLDYTALKYFRVCLNHVSAGPDSSPLLATSIIDDNTGSLSVKFQRRMEYRDSGWINMVMPATRRRRKSHALSCNHAPTLLCATRDGRTWHCTLASILHFVHCSCLNLINRGMSFDNCNSITRNFASRSRFSLLMKEFMHAELQ